MPARSRRQADESADEGEDIIADAAPTTIDPYAVLNVDTNATAAQITSAYRKAALKSHPDKVPAEEKEDAHTKFQEVAFAYAILSDERRRKRYDTTGRTEESLDLEDDDFNWLDFFREQFRNVVTVEKIDDFAASYKGSEEEKGHVLKAYTQCKGNMDKLYSAVMLSEVVDDEERFRAIIDAAIEAGEVEDFPAYSEETDKKRKARMARAEKKRAKERKEYEEEVEASATSATKGKGKGGKKKGGEDDLAALIQARQGSRAGGQGSFLEKLEAKYAPKGQKRGSAGDDDGPPEEAFAKNRKMGKEMNEDADAKAGASTRSSKRTKR